MALTKYVNAVTILTPEVSNTWYGGLYGTSEGSELAATDPSIAGHAHDGLHEDGHAQKINLTDHVTGELSGSLLVDGTVTPAKLSFDLTNSIIINDEESVVAGGPHTEITFAGAGVTATDAGSGVALVTIPGGGSGSGITLTYDEVEIPGGPHTTFEFFGDGVSIANSGSGIATFYIDADPEVIIQSEGVTITDSPHTTLNFVGDNITATDSGGGVAAITVESLPYLQVFADEAARVADATSYSASDLYKKALQLDTLQEFVLTVTTPVWSELGVPVEESYKILSMTDTQFPLVNTGAGTFTTVTFDAAPADILIKRIEITSIDDPQNPDDPSDEDYFDVESNGSYIEIIEVDGTQIDSTGVLLPMIYSDEGSDTIDLNLPLSSGEVLSLDFGANGVSNVAVLYVDQPATLPPVNNFLGAASPTFFKVMTGPTVYSTATITVDSVPPADPTFSFSNNFTNEDQSLTGEAFARTSGLNDFDYTVGTINGLATEIAAAINDGGNGFSGLFTAAAVTDTVTLTAAFPGPIGDLTQLSSPSADFTLIDFTGGTIGAVETFTFAAASATLPVGSVIKRIETMAFGGDGAVAPQPLMIEALKIDGGSNELDTQINGTTTDLNFSQKENVELDISIAASEVVTLELRSWVPGLLVFANIVIESP